VNETGKQKKKKKREKTYKGICWKGKEVETVEEIDVLN
jgi:hypothetical protein